LGDQPNPFSRALLVDLTCKERAIIIKDTILSEVEKVGEETVGQNTSVAFVIDGGITAGRLGCHDREQARVHAFTKKLL
jgi:hypothetical protein